MPPCLLKRSDGATLYATRDIAAALDRWERYHFAKSLYVVDVAQTLHFKQVFGVLRRLGCEWAERLEHVSFGRYSFAEGSMSTRKGRIVFLEDVFDEAVARVRAIIAQRNPDLPDSERVAEQVGIGAVIFFDLKHSRIRDITFSWDEAVNLEGDTGPYVQYTYARTASLLRKAGAEAWRAPEDVRALDVPEAVALLVHLDRFGLTVQTAAEDNEPSQIARYLLDLASLFNSFYHEHRIVVDEPEVREARLALAGAVGQVLRNGLALLGMQAPEAM